MPKKRIPVTEAATEVPASRCCRVFVVDDHPVFAFGIAKLIETQPDMKFAATATEGEAAVVVYRICRPDVVLMDLRLPGISGIEAMMDIKREFPDVRCIILSGYDWEEDVHHAMRSGARAYLRKDTSMEDIMKTVRAVWKGDPVLPRFAVGQQAKRWRRERLTNRERGILQMLVQGESNREIASSLGISDETVRTHLRSVFRKLRVHDRKEAAVCAVRYGIVQVA